MDIGEREFLQIWALAAVCASSQALKDANQEHFLDAEVARCIEELQSANPGAALTHLPYFMEKFNVKAPKEGRKWYAAVFDRLKELSEEDAMRRLGQKLRTHGGGKFLPHGDMKRLVIELADRLKGET